MTIAAAPIDLADVEHLTLSNVPWDFYEQVLATLESGATRVTFADGEIEIISPLPKHEQWISRIGRLLEMLALEKRIPIESLGSTTFRSKPKQKGLEPDRCYYVQHADAVGDIEGAFDPATQLPPDLAIEIDITRRSIPREPIYAALRVPELWRFDGSRLQIRLLNTSGAYEDASSSLAFPFLPMPEFMSFVKRMATDPQLKLFDEFRAWVRSI
jgi:Uma2 family endonuclease